MKNHSLKQHSVTIEKLNNSDFQLYSSCIYLKNNQFYIFEINKDFLFIKRVEGKNNLQSHKINKKIYIKFNNYLLPLGSYLIDIPQSNKDLIVIDFKNKIKN